jgi:hypothetical protein
MAPAPRRERLCGDRLAIGQRLVEAQLSADQNHGHHPGAAHIGDDLAHELVQLRFVHRSLPIWTSRRVDVHCG